MTTSPSPPKPPVITTAMLLEQFWLDIFGKEVQSAATYSYLWMADQMGHICIGLVLDFALTLVAGWVIHALGGPAYDGNPWPADLTGVLLTALVVSFWELKAYLASVNEATGRFPLDRVTLRRNAVVAAAYMAVGGVVGFAFHQYAWTAILITVAMALVAIVLAPSWLRQKIIWQKASLPYLFRLADAKPTISEADAQAVLDWMGRSGLPEQLVVAGPIGSGRTSLATGIGSECAFAAESVRYLSFDKLLEFSVTTRRQGDSVVYADDPGPRNIGYWSWHEAQVLVIDDIGPVVGGHDGDGTLAAFKKLLDGQLGNIQAELGCRDSVWVIGDLAGLELNDESQQKLQDYADAIARFCQSQTPPVVVRLASPPVQSA